MILSKPHQKCYDVVRQLLKPGSSVLEISCGKGMILGELAAAGYKTVGTNYSDYDTTPEGVEIRTGVDVTGGLPFDDNSFNCVCLCDVIEHIPNHLAALKEVVRVTAADGYIIILTPNTNRINSRLHFLFTGFFKIKRAFIGFDVDTEKSFAFHNHPPHLPVYLYQLASLGMRLNNLGMVGLKPKSVLMWLFFSPAIKLGTWLTTVVGERYLKGRESGRMLFRTLTSFAALNGETAVIVHQKRIDDPIDTGHSTRLPVWSKRS